MGARLVTLREGRGAPLFLIPGGDGTARDLTGLAQALRPGRPVAGVEPFAAASVEAMGGLAAAAIRERQPQGPYRLIGYSFGGLVALEAARVLRAGGEEVALLGMIDAVYDRRFWPAGLFALAQARRTWLHLGRLLRRPAGEALPELKARVTNLTRRLAARGKGAANPAAANDGPVAWQAAMAAWTPRAAPAPLTFFGSQQDADFGCDPAALWPAYAPALEIRRVAATHKTLVREPKALAALATEIDGALARAETTRPPRVLLAASFNWIAGARLALGLSEAGFAVQAACPRNHVLWRLGFLERLHPLRLFAERRSLARAIDAARPDLVIPCDDRSAQALHALHAAADPGDPKGAALRALLVRSLGPSETFAWIYSRAGLMVLAEEEGTPHPDTARVRSLGDLVGWMAANPGAAVLKTDGAWGGRELGFIDGPDDAADAFRRLSRPPGLPRALKRLMVEGDAEPLRAFVTRRKPSLSVQTFVPGAPGNAAVACLDGEVLAAVYAEVVRSDGATGPATVVRVVDHTGMARTVRTLVRRLGLSGLCGFDFILDAETGEAKLLELNPRATPTAHLIGANGDDLMAALAAALRRARVPRRPRPNYAGGMVALFPQEMRRDPVSAFLKSAHHDIPWQAPDLVELALARPQTPRAAFERLSRRFAARG